MLETPIRLQLVAIVAVAGQRGADAARSGCQGVAQLSGAGIADHIQHRRCRGQQPDLGIVSNFRSFVDKF